MSPFDYSNAHTMTKILVWSVNEYGFVDLEILELGKRD